MIKNVLIDVDGVLWEHGKTIKGAKETLEFLEKNNYKHLIVTNMSRMTKKELIKLIGKGNVKLHEKNILTPTHATIDFVKSKKKNPTCFLVASPNIKKEFKKFGVKVVENEKADFVIVFWFEKTTYKMLDTAFNCLKNGAELVAANIVKFAPLGKGKKPALGPGAFVKGLEYSTGKTTTVIGKPSKEFFTAALLNLNAKASETIMIGDSLEADIAGAQNSGIKAVLVKTGNYNEAELEKSVIKPDFVIESIADLPRFLKEQKE